jgi:hypothetical protein
VSKPFSKIKKRKIQSLLKQFEKYKTDYSAKNLTGNTTLNRELLRDHFDAQVTNVFVLNDNFKVTDVSKTCILLESQPIRLAVALGSDNVSIARKLRQNEIVEVQLKAVFADFFCDFKYPNYFLRNQLKNPVKLEHTKQEPCLLKIQDGKYVLTHDVDSQGFISQCFIATAATGSYEHPMVKDLRVFRDQILLSSQIGSAFVNWYYTKSPRIAAYIGKNKISRFLTRNFFVRPLAFIARFLTRK